MKNKTEFLRATSCGYSHLRMHKPLFIVYQRVRFHFEFKDLHKGTAKYSKSNYSFLITSLTACLFPQFTQGGTEWPQAPNIGS